MCGRFTLTKKSTDIMDLLKVESWDFDFIWNPNYNISPTQNTPILTFNNERIIQLMRWGLVPCWAKDSKIGNHMINARAETITEKPAYRNLIHSQRCIVIADGYYEWMQTNGIKQPFFIHHPEKEILHFAGLWDRWLDDTDKEWLSYTMITTEPTDSISHIHQRMPVILNKSSLDIWINSDVSSDKAIKLLKPFANKLAFYPVSSFVNSPANNELNCLETINLETI